MFQQQRQNLKENSLKKKTLMYTFEGATSVGMHNLSHLVSGATGHVKCAF